MQNDAVEGEILAGKYRIERVLGRGGMGMVVAAHHIQLDEKVAIKFLLPEAVASAEVVARFVREGRAAVRIKSEHVARVSDVGTLESGAPYLVMEYLEGSDLAAWIERSGALPIEQAVEFVLQACEAIAEAHALGIVHRDLKPANLFVVRRADGLLSIKVLDFGISKVRRIGGSGDDVSLTQTEVVMGSPLYMPPEQMAASKGVDARADIWSLGVILFELLGAQPPFTGQTLLEVCIKIAVEPPQSLRILRPDVPAALEAVILRCLEKDRERRYSNVAELAHELAGFVSVRARNSVDRITRTIAAAGLSRHEPSESRPPMGVTRAPSVAVVTALEHPGANTEAPWGHTARATRPSKVARSAVFIRLSALVALAAIALGATYWLRAPAPGLATNANQGPSPKQGAGSPLAPAAAPVVTRSPLVPAELAAPDLPLEPIASSTPPPPFAKPLGAKTTPRGATVPKRSPTSGSAPVTTQKSNIYDDR